MYPTLRGHTKIGILKKHNIISKVAFIWSLLFASFPFDEDRLERWSIFCGDGLFFKRRDTDVFWTHVTIATDAIIVIAGAF